MRRRLRNYVAVVMTLLLCMGLWFQHGQMVKAEGEQTATVRIYPGTDNGIMDYFEIGAVPINGFSAKTSEDGMTTYTGTISLTSEDIENPDPDERYLLYWYTSSWLNADILPEPLTLGNSVPETDINLLNLQVNPGITEGVYDISVTLYAKYGEMHSVSYYLNESMDGINPGTLDKTVDYYQKDVSVTGDSYSHPEAPTGENEDAFFIGWSLTQSGDVQAPPSTFTYGEGNLDIYAMWKNPCQLTVNYYQTEAEMQDQKPYYGPVTELQKSLSDTSITFTTMPGAKMDGEFFAGWQYKDETGAVFTLAENEEKAIAIPEDGSDVWLDLYGIWTPAAKLQVTYDMGGEFDPYTVEVEQASISDTTFSFETSNEAEPPSDFAIFEGWSYTNASGKTVTIGAGETCSDIPITTTAVTMTAVWKEPLQSGSTVSAGTHTLLAGEPYILGSGSWTVTYGGSGDSCTYAGGSTFYVTSAGDYTFADK